MKVEEEKVPDVLGNFGCNVEKNMDSTSYLSI
jgi:hypothetical protein